MNSLYKDGLHLLYSGKGLLAKKHKQFLTKTNIPSKHTPELKASSLYEENNKLSEMESYRNIRKKYFRNPLMGYLPINSL